jgi:hypothetical protein
MRLPTKVKSDDFLALPAPRVALSDIQAVIRAERDEDQAQGRERVLGHERDCAALLSTDIEPESAQAVARDDAKRQGAESHRRLFDGFRGNEGFGVIGGAQSVLPPAGEKRPLEPAVKVRLNKH